MPSEEAPDVPLACALHTAATAHDICWISIVGQTNIEIEPANQPQHDDSATSVIMQKK